MFGAFLNKLKQGGITGNGGNANIAKEQFHPQPSQGFVGPMVNQGLSPMNNASPMGMNKAPGFGFMKAKTVPQTPMTGPQRPRPNRGKLRSF